MVIFPAGSLFFNKKYSSSHTHSVENVLAIAKCYFDTATDTIVHIKKIEYKKTNTFVTFIINDAYLCKVRRKGGYNTDLYVRYEDKIPHLYTSLTPLMQNLQAKWKTMNVAHIAAQKVVAKFDKNKKHFSSVMTEYPEYFV